MTRNLFEQEWKQISSTLRIAAKFNVEILLSGGQLVHAPVLLPHFGSRKGMLLFSKSMQIEGVANQIAQDGYGYSILSEPTGQEVKEVDWGSTMEMLSDWGWSGDASQTPEWFQGEIIN